MKDEHQVDAADKIKSLKEPVKKPATIVIGGRTYYAEASCVHHTMCLKHGSECSPKCRYYRWDWETLPRYRRGINDTQLSIMAIEVMRKKDPDEELPFGDPKVASLSVHLGIPQNRLSLLLNGISKADEGEKDTLGKAMKAINDSKAGAR